MKALITGGTGFIGSYLVKELISRGTEVTLLTACPTKIQYKDRLLDVILTTYQYDELVPKLSGRNYDIFYHLGWGGVDGKDKNDIPLQSANIQIAIDMIRLSKTVGCELFVAAGTVAEYVFCKDVIDFSMKQTPNDVYGATKVAVHYLLEAISKQIGQDMIWAVLPSTFGEGRKGDNILTYTIKMLINKKYPIYGKLDQMWDFLYVTEVARALVELGDKGRHNMTYGIGSGEYRPLKEYICNVRDMIDPKLPLGIGELPVKETQPLSSCVDIGPLTRDTGFVPRISFEEGMKRTIQYYMGHTN